MIIGDMRITEMIYIIKLTVIFVVIMIFITGITIMIIAIKISVIVIAIINTITFPYTILVSNNIYIHYFIIVATLAKNSWNKATAIKGIIMRLLIILMAQRENEREEKRREERERDR